MKPKPLNDGQIDDLVAALDHQAEQLDPATLARLAQMRRTALDALPAPRPRHRSAWYGGAVAASALLAALLLWPSPQPEPLQLVEQLELLTEGEDLELLEEDPDFYLWLASEEPDAA